MDDNFSSIVQAIMWIRRINDTIRKFCGSRSRLTSLLWLPRLSPLSRPLRNHLFCLQCSSFTSKAWKFSLPSHWQLILLQGHFWIEGRTRRLRPSSRWRCTSRLYCHVPDHYYNPHLSLPQQSDLGLPHLHQYSGRQERFYCADACLQHLQISILSTVGNWTNKLNTFEVLTRDYCFMRILLLGLSRLILQSPFLIVSVPQNSGF
jgi:hypothetical protein